MRTTKLSVQTLRPNLVRADAYQRGWFACNGVAVHAVPRAPLNLVLSL
jgi:hypothetical protein